MKLGTSELYEIGIEMRLNVFLTDISFTIGLNFVKV